MSREKNDYEIWYSESDHQGPPLDVYEGHDGDKWDVEDKRRRRILSNPQTPEEELEREILQHEKYLEYLKILREQELEKESKAKRRKEDFKAVIVLGILGLIGLAILLIVIENIDKIQF